jgi:hypothetical protein
MRIRVGYRNVAAAGEPPSPVSPIAPVPANVAMAVGAEKLPVRMRIRALAESAMKMPVGPTATPVGSLSERVVGAEPSPLNPALPLPATVVMFPGPVVRTFATSSRRIRLFPVSAM